MSVAGLVTMLVILSVVWGGFLWALGMAVRRESQKRRSEDGR
jgi:hypothetical protein